MVGYGCGGWLRLKTPTPTAISKGAKKNPTDEPDFGVTAVCRRRAGQVA